MSPTLPFHNPPVSWVRSSLPHTQTEGKHYEMAIEPWSLSLFMALSASVFPPLSLCLSPSFCLAVPFTFRPPHMAHLVSPPPPSSGGNSSEVIRSRSLWGCFESPPCLTDSLIKRTFARLPMWVLVDPTGLMPKLFLKKLQKHTPRASHCIVRTHTSPNTHKLFQRAVLQVVSGRE